jgi:radical SAM superfamily enzyme YgiQ (UPF0313 family)
VSKTRDVIRQIVPYQETHQLEFFVDFIIDNPYETKDDISRTYRYLCELSPKIRANIYCLSFFPGTPIYDRAVKDGVVEPYNAIAFRSISNSWGGRVSYQENYETLLVFLAANYRHRVPQYILRLLGSYPVRIVASLLPKFIIRRLLPKLSLTRRIIDRERKISSKAINQSSNPASHYFSRGLVYQMRGRKAEAMADFKKCIKLSGDTGLKKMAERLIEKNTVS